MQSFFLLEADQDAGSEDTLRARFDAEPENAMLRFQLGNDMVAAGKYPEALEMLYSAAERDKKLGREGCARSWSRSSTPGVSGAPLPTITAPAWPGSYTEAEGRPACRGWRASTDAAAAGS